jgi:peptidoglycan hydrolase-like protein with peptidoglycan-binding domain
MKKEIVFVAAAVIALNAAPIWAQSVGGTQSKRAGDSDTPVGEGRFGDPGKADKSSGSVGQSSKGAGQTNRDTSIGGTQSKRSGESDTPVGQGRFGDAGKAAPGSRDLSQSSGTAGQQDVRQAQQALKNQGHDPGPIDGVMGPQTRQALREFQSSNGLQQTGMLDAQTKQKLNIDDTSSRGSRPARGESSAPMGK